MAEINVLTSDKVVEEPVEQERINTQLIPPKSIKQRNLGDNSVGSAQIQDDSVAPAQLIEPITLTSPVINTPTGDVATITGTQTLTNKTLTSPTIASFVNANHTHTDAASGGVITGKVVQMKNVQTGAVATGTTVVPDDDTIPQITEGNEYMTLAITPTNASNILLIEVTWFGNGDIADSIIIVSLFVGTTADALASVAGQVPANYRRTVTFTHKVTAGVTTELTFRVRAGLHASGTTTFNGTGGARKYGGVAASSITITEYTP